MRYAYLQLVPFTGQSLPTMVSGGIYNDVTWALSGSPYLITSSIVVFPGRTLTIEPGVEVLVESVPFGSSLNYLEIRGNLIAEGTAAAPIVFKGYNQGTTKGTWEGIYFKFSQGGYANIDNFHLKNSNYGIFADQVLPDTLTFNNCVFMYNYFGFRPYSGVIFNNSIFKDNDRACDGLGTPDGTVYNAFQDCIFENNTQALVYMPGTTMVTNCLFKNNIYALTSSLTGVVENSIFKNNINATYICSGLDFNSCIFDGNTTAIYYFRDATIEAKIKDGYDDITLGLLNYAVFDSTCTNILSTVIKVNLSTAIDDTKNNSLFQIYPNPASITLTINALYTDILKADIRIMDLMGREFITQKIDLQAQSTLDISNLPSGIYLLSLASNNQKEVVRFYKE